MERKMKPGQPSLKVRNAAQAVDTALSHLHKNHVQNTPGADTKWQEKTIYSPENPDYAITGKMFTSDDWWIEIFQGVVPLSNTVYKITVFNAKLNYYWKGSVKADGSVTEAGAFRLLSEEESRSMSEEFLKKSQVPPPRPGSYGH